LRRHRHAGEISGPSFHTQRCQRTYSAWRRCAFGVVLPMLHQTPCAAVSPTLWKRPTAKTPPWARQGFLRAKRGIGNLALHTYVAGLAKRFNKDCRNLRRGGAISYDKCRAREPGKHRH
jgi:hypothetical protein